MPVQQNVLPGHRRYPGQILNTFVVTLCFRHCCKDRDSEASGVAEGL